MQLFSYMSEVIKKIVYQLNWKTTNPSKPFWVFLPVAICKRSLSYKCICKHMTVRYFDKKCKVARNENLICLLLVI